MLFLDIAYLSESSLLLLWKRDLDSQHVSFLVVSQTDIVDKCRCVAVVIYFFEQNFIITRKVREMENADYLQTHKDYSESVDALERAIATMKKQDYDRTQLLQVNKLEIIPEHAKKVIFAIEKAASFDTMHVVFSM